MQKNSFTLIELLVVIAMIGVLIITGYPSYLSYLREARRQDAIQELLKFQITIEDYITRNNALPDPAVSPYTPYSSTNGLYTVTYSRVDTSNLIYQIDATAITETTQINDVAGATSCSTLTLNNTIEGITPYVCK